MEGRGEIGDRLSPILEEVGKVGEGLYGGTASPRTKDCPPPCEIGQMRKEGSLGESLDKGSNGGLTIREAVRQQSLRGARGTGLSLGMERG